MHALELPVDIDENHQIHLQLPETIKARKGKIIFMYEDDNAQPSKPFKFGLFEGQMQMSDDFNKPLCNFLNQLPELPENTGLSRDEIQQYIQQERQSWDK